MKRMLWLGIGLAVGALVVRAAAKKAQALTPQGIAGSLQESASGLVDSVRGFVEDVRENMAEREQEIHAAFAQGQAFDEGTGGSGTGGSDADDEFMLERDPQEGTR